MEQTPISPATGKDDQPTLYKPNSNTMHAASAPWRASRVSAATRSSTTPSPSW